MTGPVARQNHRMILPRNPVSIISQLYLFSQSLSHHGDLLVRPGVKSFFTPGPGGEKILSNGEIYNN